MHKIHKEKHSNNAQNMAPLHKNNYSFHQNKTHSSFTQHTFPPKQNKYLSLFHKVYPTFPANMKHMPPRNPRQLSQQSSEERFKPALEEKGHKSTHNYLTSRSDTSKVNCYLLLTSATEHRGASIVKQ